MAIVLCTDSDGYAYQIWAQDQPCSCGVASIWMARNQAFQQSVDEDEWHLAWRIYSQVVQNIPDAFALKPPPGVCLSPSAFKPNQQTFQNMFGAFGAYMNQVAAALTNDGLKVTFLTQWSAGMVVDPSKLSDTTPAIVMLGWYQGAKRNGGHFIVASRKTRSGKVVYLDPWQGQLRELGAGPIYPGSGVFEQVVYISA